MLPPNVLISSSIENSVLLAGSALNLTCNVNIDTLLIDSSDYQINKKWYYKQSSHIIEVSSGYHDKRINLDETKSILMFDTLSSTHDVGSYTCSVFLSSTNEFIKHSNIADSTVAINIEGNYFNFIIHHIPYTFTDPKIENFTLTPHEVIAVEDSCNNYDKITSFHLKCSASKPLLVVPDLKLFWIYDGLQSNWNTTERKYYDKSTVTVVSELNITTATTGGNYYCVAQIYIPNSRQIHELKESIVTLKGKYTTNGFMMYYILSSIPSKRSGKLGFPCN